MASPAAWVVLLMGFRPIFLPKVGSAFPTAGKNADAFCFGGGYRH